MCITHILFLQQTRQQPTTDLLIRIILAFWFVPINEIFVFATPSVIRSFIDDKSTLVFNWISDMIVIEIEVHHTLIEILLSRCVSDYCIFHWFWAREVRR